MSSNVEKRGHAEVVFYLSMVAISIGLFVYVWLQPWAYRQTMDGLGMAIFPTVFIAIVVIASIGGVLLEKRHGESLKQSTKEERFLLWPVSFISIAAVASTYGFRHIDPTITSGAFVLILLLGVGVRDWRLLAGLPIGTGLLIYVLFVRVMGTYFRNVWF